MRRLAQARCAPTPRAKADVQSQLAEEHTAEEATTGLTRTGPQGGGLGLPVEMEVWGREDSKSGLVCCGETPSQHTGTSCVPGSQWSEVRKGLQLGDRASTQLRGDSSLAGVGVHGDEQGRGEPG